MAYTTEERKRVLKSLLKDYKTMNRALERQLNKLGIVVVHSKHHVKLYCDGRLYITSATASDWRSGKNLASVMCRDM